MSKSNKLLISSIILPLILIGLNHIFAPSERIYMNDQMLVILSLIMLIITIIIGFIDKNRVVLYISFLLIGFICLVSLLQCISREQLKSLPNRSDLKIKEIEKSLFERNELDESGNNEI